MSTRLLVMACVLAVAACGPPDPGGPPGTIHGRVIGSGGPSGATDIPLPATVAVSRTGHRVTQQRVSETKGYRFALSPGTYRLTVIDLPVCDSPTVVMAPDTDQEIDLTCQLK